MRKFNSGESAGEVVFLTPDSAGVKNTRFESAKFVDSDKGGYLQITFKQLGTGALFSHMESDIDPTYNSPTEIAKTKDGKVDKLGRTFYDKAVDDQEMRFKHLFGALTGINYNEKPVQGTDYKSYCEAYIATINVEKAKQMPIHWLNLRWTYNKNKGVAKVIFPNYPPFLSTELKPRDWKDAVTDYDRKNRVFDKPVGETNQGNDEPTPDDENEVPATKAAYEDDDAEVEEDADEVSSDEDEDEVV